MSYGTDLSFLETVKCDRTSGTGGLYGRYLGTSLYIFFGLEGVVWYSQKKEYSGAPLGCENNYSINCL